MVLAHFLMIDQLSATADCCQQMALKLFWDQCYGQRLYTVYLSGGMQPRGSWLVLSCCLLSCFLESLVPVIFPDTVSLKAWHTNVATVHGQWQYIAYFHGKPLKMDGAINRFLNAPIFLYHSDLPYSGMVNLYHFAGLLFVDARTHAHNVLYNPAYTICILWV